MTWIVARVLTLLIVVFDVGAVYAETTLSGYSTYAHSIPPRPKDAITGSEFLKRAGNINPELREELIYKEISKGNIPDRLRYLRPVTIDGTVGGKQVRLVTYVLSDYMAIGSNEDYVLIPMNLYTAARIAKLFGFSLPTTKMVDAIHKQAEVRLQPLNLKPGSKMTTSHYYQEHSKLVADALKKKGEKPNSRNPLLLAGHKKDLVLTKKLSAKPNSIAIYGWHNRAGQAIQPVSTVHLAGYADYSHGVRFVSETVYVNGQPMSLYKVLGDSQLAPLMSKEGRIRNANQILAGFQQSPSRMALGN